MLFAPQGFLRLGWMARLRNALFRFRTRKAG
jgi:hypothetical protein